MGQAVFPSAKKLIAQERTDGGGARSGTRTLARISDWDHRGSSQVGGLQVVGTRLAGGRILINSFVREGSQIGY